MSNLSRDVIKIVRLNFHEVIDGLCGVWIPHVSDRHFDFGVLGDQLLSLFFPYCDYHQVVGDGAV